MRLKDDTGSGQARQGKTYPYPVGKEARARAKKLHDAAGRKTKPWFYRASDNTFHRWDNKGKGVLGLIDAKRKLYREAIYKANQDKLTPKLVDYEAVFGKDKAQAIFNAEQSRLRQIYKNYDPRKAQIDHLQSKRSGGLHISRNLNAQNAFANMSEGNRGVLPKDIASKLMVDPGGDIRKTIAIQGPELTEAQKNQVMGRGNEGGKGVKGIKPSRKLVEKAGYLRIANRGRKFFNTGGDNPQTNIEGNVQSLQPFQQFIDSTYPPDFVDQGGYVPPIGRV